MMRSACERGVAGSRRAKVQAALQSEGQHSESILLLCGDFPGWAHGDDRNSSCGERTVNLLCRLDRSRLST